MPKSATSKPSGYGGMIERPFTWWVAPVMMGSSRPGSVVLGHRRLAEQVLQHGVLRVAPSLCATRDGPVTPGRRPQAGRMSTSGRARSASSAAKNGSGTQPNTPANSVVGTCAIRVL